MATHNFTAERMSKFLGAVGAHIGVDMPQIEGGEYTTEQLLEMASSRGGLHDWPNHTDDPRINYVVDCVVQSESFSQDIDYKEPEWDESMYSEEVRAFKDLEASRQA